MTGTRSRSGSSGEESELSEIAKQVKGKLMFEDTIR
jgi:hypothetical protein